MLSRVGLLKRQVPIGRFSNGLYRPITQTLYKRAVSTVKASHDEEQTILLNQRKNRPTSPHLNIYQPQLTWILSSFHRLTGVVMAFGFYGVTCGYAACSILGLPLDVSAIIAGFGALPLLVKIGVKSLMSFPFVYHGFNGIRHIAWDFGRELTIPGVYRTGYAVLALTGILGSYLVFV